MDKNNGLKYQIIETWRISAKLEFRIDFKISIEIKHQENSVT